MAKFFVNGKWKKRSIAALSMALSLTFSLGIFTACGSPDKDDDDDDDGTSTTEVDTQPLKNGNFEFYSEKNKELDEKRALINSPTSWSFSSGSPSSKTSSGIISVSEWDYLTKAGYNDGKGFPENGEDVDTAAVIADVAAHWNDESVTAYDRLKFYDDFSKEIKALSENSTEAKLFADYKYSIDYEDVEKLREELGEELVTHPTEEDEEESENLLMIHNSVEQYDVLGTAQYYTSSTTITLQAGTAAQVSVWVKTANLFHYYDEEDPVAVTKDAGAYIGVTHTVGGSSLPQMQVKNINTDGNWQEYTLYIRANTFATSTFKLVLGLGMGDSNNRFEAVNGYALFDDISCTILPASEYKTDKLSGAECYLNSEKDAKIFDASSGTHAGKTEFGLDLHEQFKALNLDATTDVTKEMNGPKEYESLIESNIGDGNEGSVVGKYAYDDLEKEAANNVYLKSIFEKDFKNFPFEKKGNIIMLLSTNGAAYTATVNSATVGNSDGNSSSDNVFELKANDYMLVSFFVKTSKIRSGKLGASAVLVDGENETTISAFDSTTISTVDIDETQTDIYDGWVQCFFFVKNETKEARKFTLKLSYGPTSIANSTINDYDDGYAAFANFETMKLSKTQYGYASSSSSRAQTVSLTGKIGTDSKFDNNAASRPFANGQLGAPVNFEYKLSGTKEVAGLDKPRTPDPEKLEDMGIYSGLLNADPEYVNKYKSGTEDWNDLLNGIGGSGNDAKTWWNTIFGDSNRKGYVANQPLVIMNTSEKELPAYGYFATTTTSVSANGTQQISMRVKVGGNENTVAYIYLTDTSDVKAGYKNQLAPAMPNVTYWYDDEGNICKEDPTDKKKPEIAYYLEPNGLYTSADKTDTKYYANLANYKKDDDGNYVTSDDKTVFYYNDGKYYAYYDKKTETYSTEVTALPADENLVRYTAPAGLAEKSACIKVENTNGNWVDVSFFVRAGSEAKNYRLEIWAGSRDCEIDNDYNITSAGKGIPAGGYVFFDDYTSSSAGDYDSMLQGYVDDVKDTLNKDNGKKPGDEGYFGKNDNLPESYAYYYTFTFYDSPDYVRYDETVDEDWLGYNYTQSEQKEKLIWFNYVSNGSLTGMPAYAQFIDYSANDQSVSKETLKDDNTSSGDTDEDTNNKNNTANILTIVSSVIFALAIVFAIGAVIVRKVMKKRGKSGSSKKAKQKKDREPKLKVVKSEEAPKAEAEPEDENNPYNE